MDIQKPDYEPCWLLDLEPGNLDLENLINVKNSKLAKTLKPLKQNEKSQNSSYRK